MFMEKTKLLLPTFLVVICGLELSCAIIEEPLSGIQHLNKSTNHYYKTTHTAYKWSTLSIQVRCHDTSKTSSSQTSVTAEFNLQFSYSNKDCYFKNQSIDEPNTNVCSIRVNCSKSFSDSRFASTAYQVSNGVVTNNNCTAFSADIDEKSIKLPMPESGLYRFELKAVDIHNNSDEKKPIGDSITVDVVLELQQANKAALMLMDNPVYKNHIAFCCLYFITVATCLFYFLYLKKTANTVHIIIGLSFTAGLLASFFNISLYQKLNQHTAFASLKGVVAIASVLSAIDRVAIDIVVVMISSGHSIFQNRVVSVNTSILMLSIYIGVYILVEVIAHLRLSSYTFHVLLFIQSLLITVMYAISAFLLRNTLMASYRHQSPHVDYTVAFYRRFLYLFAILLIVVIIFILYTLSTLVLYWQCQDFWHVVFQQVFWEYNSIVTGVALFLLVVFHPNVHMNIFRSFGSQYDYFASHETINQSTYVPITSANVEIRRSNPTINNAFTLFDEDEQSPALHRTSHYAQE